MTLGGYAEAVVADALPGSVESPEGTARVDIKWQPTPRSKPILVEVKSSRGGKWSTKASSERENGFSVRRRRADVYVLASHEGDDHRSGWTFNVVPCWRIDGWDRKTISSARLSRWGVEE